MSDMPLPMPFCVMSSPIPHNQRGAGSEGKDHEKNRPHVEPWQENETATQAVGTVEQEGEAGRLDDRNRDRHVAGPLGDLALTNSTLLLPLLDSWNHDTQDLHDDRCRDVRQHAEGKDRKGRQTTTGEQLDIGQDAALLFGVLTQLLDGEGVNSRSGNERAQAVQAKSEEGKEDLVSKIRYPEHVCNS